jgi:hypothetical protein
VSGNARIRDARKDAFFGKDIAVTHSAGFDTNPDLPRAGLRNFTLHDFEVCSRFRHLNRFHLCHFVVPFVSDCCVGIGDRETGTSTVPAA